MDGVKVWGEREYRHVRNGYRVYQGLQEAGQSSLACGCAVPCAIAQREHAVGCLSSCSDVGFVFAAGIKPADMILYATNGKYFTDGFKERKGLLKWQPSFQGVQPTKTGDQATPQAFMDEMIKKLDVRRALEASKGCHGGGRWAVGGGRGAAGGRLAQVVAWGSLRAPGRWRTWCLSLAFVCYSGTTSRLCCSFPGTARQVAWAVCR